MLERSYYKFSKISTGMGTVNVQIYWFCLYLKLTVQFRIEMLYVGMQTPLTVKKVFLKIGSIFRPLISDKLYKQEDTLCNSLGFPPRKGCFHRQSETRSRDHRQEAGHKEAGVVHKGIYGA